MYSPRDDQYLGSEFDWLGVGQLGHVAVFIAWGWGPFPAGVAQHLDEVAAAMDRIEELPAIGPPSSARSDARDHPLFWDGFADKYAAKGFYVYHWDGDGAYDESRRYVRFFAPPVLVTVSQLSVELRAVARFAEFTVNFAEAGEITIGSS